MSGRKSPAQRKVGIIAVRRRVVLAEVALVVVVVVAVVVVEGRGSSWLLLL